MVHVNWETYYDAGKKCHDLAGELRAADKPVHDAIKGECAGMAGDAPGCRQWGETYDRIAQETMQTCTHLADALTNFGNILYAAGYNYGISDENGPTLPQPSIHSVSEYKVTIPTSVHDNGNGVKHNGGVEEFFSELTAQIVSSFEKLPNGDVDKLSVAATIWQKFSQDETVSGAGAKIASISTLFDDMDDLDNRRKIQEKFGTLKNGADNLAAASLNVAAPVAEYHTSAIEVGDAIKSLMNGFAWAVGLLVAGAAIGALFSFGGSIALGGVGVGAAATETVTAIRGLYTSRRLFQILKITLAAGVTVGVIDAFDEVPSLSEGITALAAIIAMKVYVDSDDAVPADTNRPTKVPKSGGSGKENATDAPSWAKGKAPYVGESGKAYARRLMDEHYGPGNWEGTGPGSEFSKIKKYGDRAWQNPS